MRLWRATALLPFADDGRRGLDVAHALNHLAHNLIVGRHPLADKDGRASVIVRNRVQLDRLRVPRQQLRDAVVADRWPEARLELDRLAVRIK